MKQALCTVVLCSVKEFIYLISFLVLFNHPRYWIKATVTAWGWIVWSKVSANPHQQMVFNFCICLICILQHFFTGYQATINFTVASASVTAEHFSALLLCLQYSFIISGVQFEVSAVRRARTSSAQMSEMWFLLVPDLWLRNLQFIKWLFLALF